MYARERRSERSEREACGRGVGFASEASKKNLSQSPPPTQSSLPFCAGVQFCPRIQRSILMLLCSCCYVAIMSSQDVHTTNNDITSFLCRYVYVKQKTNGICLYFVYDLFQLVVQWTLVTAVRRQMDALREGFNSVLPLSNLTSFSYTEVIYL